MKSRSSAERAANAQDHAGGEKVGQVVNLSSVAKGKSQAAVTTCATPRTAVAVVLSVALLRRTSYLLSNCNSSPPYRLFEDCIFKTVVVALAGWLNVSAAIVIVSRQLSAAKATAHLTQSDHRGQAAGQPNGSPVKTAMDQARSACDRACKPRRALRRCVGQSCGHSGFGSAINLVGKDGKDSVAATKGTRSCS